MTARRSCTWNTVAIAIAIAVAVAACGAPARSARFPEAALVDADGTTRDLRSLISQSPFTVITFFSDRCPCQSAHDARLVALHAKYSSRGVQFLVVDSEADASPERDANEARRRGYPFSIFVDARGVFARAIGAEYATYTVIVDARGAVRYAGGIDSDRTHLTARATPYVADALDDLLAGAAPRTREGKVLGCALQIK